jgi:hypothetical protein
MAAGNAFRLEALVDFPDDAIGIQQPVTARHVDAMMAALRELGVRRVSWAYYGDGHGGYFVPAMKKPTDAWGHWENLLDTYQELGHPLKAAAEAAHRHRLEIYAYYKPYETGPAISLPEGSPEAAAFGRLAQLGGRLSWLDRFVVDHPELRIKRKTGDLRADISTVPICGIKLIKKDSSPTRVTKDHLQIWTSPLNYRYRKRDIPFEIRESVEPSAKDVYDLNDKHLTRKGDPVRTLTLSGFRLTDPFIMVTTDFTDGPADFENAGPDIMVALDEHGREVPGVFGPGSAIWMTEQVDFRNWGLIFDHGYGRLPMCLDEPNGSGKRGVISYTRGRNEYLPAALCETEPAVQEYWLSCLREMLAAGVDGIDLREENHSTHTDYPEDYGYNQVVLDRANGTDPAEIARVRGEAWTEFLRRAKQLIGSHGKRMRINFQLDWYRPSPPRGRNLAYPANLDFQWRRWIDEELTDEAMLRFFALSFDSIFTDGVAAEFIERCRKRGLPITFNRYLRPESLREEYRRVRTDGRFAGFVLYETASYLRCGPDGECAVTVDEVKNL